MQLQNLSVRSLLWGAITVFAVVSVLRSLGVSREVPRSRSDAPVGYAATAPIREDVGTALSVSGMGRPVRLKIPKIKVDALIEEVGLTPQGAVDVPKGPENAAWFDLGPRPGEEGSAVMAGHYGWKNYIPAVFDNLHELQKGDELYVEDEYGEVSAFVVRELRNYDDEQDASSVFGSSDGEAHLNLITCEGVWDKVRKSYSDRLVVFADKV